MNNYKPDLVETEMYRICSWNCTSLFSNDELLARFLKKARDEELDIICMQGHTQRAIDYARLQEYGFVPVDKNKRTGAFTFFSPRFMDTHEIKRLVPDCLENKEKGKLSHECFDIVNRNDENASFMLVNVYLRHKTWEDDYMKFGESMTEYREMRAGVVIVGDFNIPKVGKRANYRSFLIPSVHDVVETPFPPTCGRYHTDAIFSSVEIQNVDVDAFGLPANNRHLHNPIFFEAKTSDIILDICFDLRESSLRALTDCTLFHRVRNEPAFAGLSIMELRKYVYRICEDAKKNGPEPSADTVKIFDDLAKCSTIDTEEKYNDFWAAYWRILGDTHMDWVIDYVRTYGLDDPWITATTSNPSMLQSLAVFT